MKDKFEFNVSDSKGKPTVSNRTRVLDSHIIPFSIGKVVLVTKDVFPELYIKDKTGTYPISKESSNIIGDRECWIRNGKDSYARYITVGFFEQNYPYYFKYKPGTYVKYKLSKGIAHVSREATSTEYSSIKE